MKDTLYVFILGRKPLLSLAELLSHFSEPSILSVKPRTCIVKTKKSIKNPQALLDTLGGTVRIAKIFERIRRPNPNKLMNETEKWTIIIKKLFKERFKNHPSKIRFGVNMYNFPHPREILLKKLLNEVKRSLTDLGLKVRFVNNQNKNIQSVVTNKERLISKNGAEISLILDEKYLSFAETIAVQNIDRYAERDYGKPCRDPRSGMLPPKVAQMMIHFALLDKNGRKNKIQAIVDPFCGTGTILMEGLLQDFHMGGSDIDKLAVQYSRKNIEWLRKKYAVHNKVKSKVLLHDATRLTSTTLKEMLQVKKMPRFAVVSEPYLGPPFFRFPEREKLETHIKYLDSLYVRFFETLSSLLPKGTVIIFAVPAFQDKTHHVRMTNTIEKIKKLGYSVKDLIPKKFAKAHGIEMPDAPSLIYDREGQIVAREIYKFVQMA